MRVPVQTSWLGIPDTAWTQCSVKERPHIWHMATHIMTYLAQGPSAYASDGHLYTTSTIGRGITTHHAAWLFLHVNQCQRMCMSHMQYLCDVVDYVVVPCFPCSTVPHKAVADVSKIGNLQEELGCWVARAAEQAADGATGGWSVGCWSACSAHRMHDCWTYGLDWPGAPMHAAFTGCRATGFTQHG